MAAQEKINFSFITCCNYLHPMRHPLLLNHPRELVGLKAFPFHTVDRGEVFHFFAVDFFTQEVFILNSARSITSQSVLLQVQALLTDEAFSRTSFADMTLVVDALPEAADALQCLLDEYGATLAFDPEYLMEFMHQPLQLILEMIQRGGGDMAR